MLAKQNGILLVLFHLPAVGRMNLLDIDDDELDAIPKALVDAVQGPSLGPKRRSGVAAENERDRSLA